MFVFRSALIVFIEYRHTFSSLTSESNIIRQYFDASTDQKFPSSQKGSNTLLCKLICIRLSLLIYVHVSFLDTTQTLCSSTSKCNFMNMMTSSTTGTDTLVVQQWSMHHSSSDAIAYSMPSSRLILLIESVRLLALFSLLLFLIFFPEIHIYFAQNDVNIEICVVRYEKKCRIIKKSRSNKTISCSIARKLFCYFINK